LHSTSDEFEKTLIEEEITFEDPDGRNTQQKSLLFFPSKTSSPIFSANFVLFRAKTLLTHTATFFFFSR
jgi:hypothetical protein